MLLPWHDSVEDTVTRPSCIFQVTYIVTSLVQVATLQFTSCNKCALALYCNCYLCFCTIPATPLFYTA